MTLPRAARARESNVYRLDTLFAIGNDLWVRYMMETSWVSFCVVLKVKSVMNYVSLFQEETKEESARR